MTTPQSTAAKASVRANNPADDGSPSRFYARNGDVFMTSAWGGYYLSEGEQARMLDLWRRDQPDPISASVQADLASELERAMADAASQKESLH